MPNEVTLLPQLVQSYTHGHHLPHLAYDQLVRQNGEKQVNYHAYIYFFLGNVNNPAVCSDIGLYVFFLSSVSLKYVSCFYIYDLMLDISGLLAALVIVTHVWLDVN